MDSKTILINLKILGKLDTGMKVNVKNSIFVLDDNVWKSIITRRLRGDDRNQTYDKISHLITEVSKIIDQPTDDVIIESVDFKEILDAAIQGLIKLKGTYQDDNTFVAKLEIEINLLTRLANKLKKTNNDESII